MQATAGELRDKNPRSILKIQETEVLSTVNLFFYNLYTTLLKADKIHGKPYRDTATSFDVSESERLRWNEHSESNIRPKYKTPRSLQRVEKFTRVIKLSSEGATIKECKTVHTRMENIVAARTRLRRKGGL